MSLMYFKKAVADTMFFLKRDRKRQTIMVGLHTRNFSFGVDIALVTTIVVLTIKASSGQFDFSMLSSLFQRREVKDEASSHNYVTAKKTE
jgi:hypothetical protein